MAFTYIAIIETPEGSRRAAMVEATSCDHALEKMELQGRLLSDIFLKETR